MRIEILDDISEVLPLLILRRNPFFQKRSRVLENRGCYILSPSAAGTLSSHKYLITGVVKDVLQEFVSLAKQMVKSSKETQKLALKSEKSLIKSHDQIEVLLKYLNLLDEDQELSEKEEDVLDTEEEDSDA
ncbi:hypothetical protein AHAS_Ahas13G0312600 [Arachis hypogaea]